MNPANGLKPLTIEDRAQNAPYTVGAYLTLPPLSEIPEEHVVAVNDDWILNQAEYDPYDDRCAGAASSIASGLLDNERTDPHFVWMMARTRAGYKIEDFGATNKDIALAYVKIGPLKFADSPYSFKDSRDIVADVTKWDVKTLLPKAIEQRKSGKGLFWIDATQGYDAYDTWRAAITKLDKLYPGKKHTCVFGLLWAYDTVNIEKPVESGTGHDTLLLGWKGGKAVLLNSMGRYSGDNGRFFVSREVFNAWAEKFGAFILVDLPPEEIKYMMENSLQIDSGWFASITKPFLIAILELLRQLKAQIGSFVV